MDNLSKEDRRKNMQRIRSKNTTPERIIMKELKRRKIYFASHVDKILGKPDIVFRRKKVLIFIDSDFWHYNPLNFRKPKSNKQYWEKKIKNNRIRDAFVNHSLLIEGWNVLRFWESDIKKDPEKIVNCIIYNLDKS
jgi:DNA mismatch endonuclease, patch repair protein